MSNSYMHESMLGYSGELIVGNREVDGRSLTICALCFDRGRLVMHVDSWYEYALRFALVRPCTVGEAHAFISTMPDDPIRDIALERLHNIVG